VLASAGVAHLKLGLSLDLVTGLTVAAILGFLAIFYKEVKPSLKGQERSRVRSIHVTVGDPAFIDGFADTVVIVGPCIHGIIQPIGIF
jgi:hypothetical protein